MGSLLQKYKGMEAELYNSVCEKYGDIPQDEATEPEQARSSTHSRGRVSTPLEPPDSSSSAAPGGPTRGPADNAATITAGSAAMTPAGLELGEVLAPDSTQQDYEEDNHLDDLRVAREKALLLFQEIDNRVQREVHRRREEARRVTDACRAGSH